MFQTFIDEFVKHLLWNEMITLEINKYSPI